MTWDRIYFDNKDVGGETVFKLEQHETKDKQGHFHLGVNGDWKTKFPNDEIKNLLLEWKIAHPEFRRFVWFEDTGTDLRQQKQRGSQDSWRDGKKNENLLQVNRK